jgi:hypothetical protein
MSSGFMDLDKIYVLTSNTMTRFPSRYVVSPRGCDNKADVVVH